MPHNLFSPCAFLLPMKTRSSSHRWKPSRPKQVLIFLRFLQQANFCLKRCGKETVKIRREVEIRRPYLPHLHRCTPQTTKLSGFSEKSSQLFQMNKTEDKAPKCRWNHPWVPSSRFTWINLSPALLSFKRKERLNKLTSSTKSMKCAFKTVGFLSCLWMTANGICWKSRRAITETISSILTLQKRMLTKWNLIIRWARTSPISLFPFKH